jgi:hypothetical protein
MYSPNIKLEELGTITHPSVVIADTCADLLTLEFEYVKKRGRITTFYNKLKIWK